MLFSMCYILYFFFSTLNPSRSPCFFSLSCDVVTLLPIVVLSPAFNILQVIPSLISFTFIRKIEENEEEQGDKKEIGGRKRGAKEGRNK